MITAQKEVLNVCDKLLNIAKDASLASDKQEKIEVMKESVEEQQLLVPIVGEFSSGKSTMINTLLRNSVLPVAITPETSLATELHYTDSDEYAEGVLMDGSTKRYEINDMKELTNEAEKYRFARVYLKNPQLKAIEPVVLVDMPGFSAPNEQHNKAIAEYLNRGIYYIVLMKVTDGTVSRSLLNRLKEIDSFERKFSFFLSNTDVVQSAKVDDVKQAVEDVLYSEFGYDIKVGKINNTDASSVQECLSQIDTNALFKNMYYVGASESCDSVIEGLNYQIKASRLDATKIQAAEDEIMRSIEKIKSTSESDIQHMEKRYSGGMINGIISDVGDALNNSTDEIVSAVMAKNNVEHLMNEIVRSALVQSMQQRIGEVNDGIVSDFSDSVKNLSEAFGNMNIDTNYTGKIVDTMQESFKTLLTFIPAGKGKNPVGGALQGASLGAGMGTVLSSTLAAPIASTVATSLGLVATAINPILGAVLVLLPTVLGGLFGLGKQKAQNAEVEAQIRSKLTGEVFPQIKSKLRTELPNILQQQVGTMIENVRNQYAQMLESQQQELAKARKDKEEKLQSTKEIGEKLEGLRAEAQEIAKEITTWKVA